MVKTKAAVFPVPDWDWPIIFVGLQVSTFDDCYIKRDRTEGNERVVEEQWKGAFLNFGWFGKTHVINSFEKVLMPMIGLIGYNVQGNKRKLTSLVLQMFSRCTKENLGPVADPPR